MPSGYCNKIAIYMSQDIEQIFDDVRKYCTLAKKKSIQYGTTLCFYSIEIGKKFFPAFDNVFDLYLKWI